VPLRPRHTDEQVARAKVAGAQSDAGDVQPVDGSGDLDVELLDERGQRPRRRMLGTQDRRDPRVQSRLLLLNLPLTW
jgi:hypothetical protein